MSLRTRLTRVEKKVADKKEQKRLASCNCRAFALVDPLTVKKFEADMNLPCPAHGVRNLGQLCVVRFIGAMDGSLDTSSPKDLNEIEMDRLLEIYHSRQSSRKNANK